MNGGGGGVYSEGVYSLVDPDNRPGQMGLAGFKTKCNTAIIKLYTICTSMPCTITISQSICCLKLP